MVSSIGNAVMLQTIIESVVDYTYAYADPSALTVSS